MNQKFEVQVFHKNSTKPYMAVRSLTHNERFMGDDSVTVSASLPEISDDNGAFFRVGDWLEYRGVKYVIDVPPSLQKQARKRAVGNSFVYDSVKFTNALIVDLTYTDFRDVANEEEHHNLSVRSFTLYCASMHSYAIKLKANLERAGLNCNIYIHGNDKDGNAANVLLGDTGKLPEGFVPVGKKNITLSFSDEKCWDSLSHIKEDFDVNFVITGDSLYLGCNGNFIAQHNFRQGKTKGLFKIERVTDESQAIVTKLRAYGTETNMPVRYYKNVSLRMKIGIRQIVRDDEGGVYISTELTKFKSNMFDNIIGEIDGVFGSGPEKMTIYGVRLLIGRTYCEADFQGRESLESKDIDYMFCVKTNVEEVVSEINNGASFLIVAEGVVGKNIPPTHVISDPNNKIPNNMNVKCLMLPGFGFQSLDDVVRSAYQSGIAQNIRILKDYTSYEKLSKVYRFSTDATDPWVAAVPQFDEYGQRESYVTFDDSNKDYDPIYPSIKYVSGEANLLPAQGETNLRIDDGVCDDLAQSGVEIQPWYLYVKDPGFDPYKQRPDGESQITVSFKDGMLGGREFECTASEKQDNGTYRLTLARKQDDALDLYFPYRATGGGADFVAKEGDEIVYLGIEMPSKYVEDAALYELLPAALETLDKNRDVQYKFNLEIDKIMMAKQHAEAASRGEESIHDVLRAGDVIMFGDADLGVSYNDTLGENDDTITATILIDSIEIKENEYALTEYTVNLVRQKNINSIEKIQKQIDAIVSGSTQISTTGGGGGGYSIAEIQRLVRTFGSAIFLSKVNEDTAKAHVSFLDGIDTTELYVKRDATVDGTLHVRRMEVDNLSIMEAKHIGGKVISSAAAMSIKEIENITSEEGDRLWKCWFVAEDKDGNSSHNMFVEGDMAYCEQFKVKDTGEYESSKCWWRKITEVGTDDEKGMHYVVVTDKLGECSDTLTDIPEVGDVVVQLGFYDPFNTHAADERSGATISSPVGKFVYKGKHYPAPYECQYAGINKFEFPDPVNVDSVSLRVVNANEINLIASGGSKNLGEVISEGFAIYSLDIESPKDEGEIEQFVALDTEGWPDKEESWTLAELSGHADPGDVAICTDSVYYRFTFDDGTYYWELITDVYLIQAIEKANEASELAESAIASLAEMADDEKIDEVEKNRLKELSVQIAAEHDNIIEEAMGNASTAKYNDSYKILVAFIEYFLAQTGTVNLKNGELDLVAQAYLGVDGLPAYRISYQRKSGSMIDAQKWTYREAYSSYYEEYAALRKKITEGILQEVFNIAIEGGYDEHITNRINEMYNAFGTYCDSLNRGESVYLGIISISDEVTKMSNWLRDPNTNSVYGSGLVFESTFSSLFSVVYDDYGASIAQALAFTSVAYDPETNTFKSSFTVKADNINLSGFVSANKGFKINLDGSMEAHNGRFTGILSVSGYETQELFPEESSSDITIREGGTYIYDSSSNFFVLGENKIVTLSEDVPIGTKVTFIDKSYVAPTTQNYWVSDPKGIANIVGDEIAPEIKDPYSCYAGVILQGSDSQIYGIPVSVSVPIDANNPATSGYGKIIDRWNFLAFRGGITELVYNGTMWVVTSYSNSEMIATNATKSSYMAYAKEVSSPNYNYRPLFGVELRAALSAQTLYALEFNQYGYTT